MQSETTSGAPSPELVPLDPPELEPEAPSPYVMSGTELHAQTMTAMPAPAMTAVAKEKRRTQIGYHERQGQQIVVGSVKAMAPVVPVLKAPRPHPVPVIVDLYEVAVKFLSSEPVQAVGRAFVVLPEQSLFLKRVAVAVHAGVLHVHVLHVRLSTVAALPPSPASAPPSGASLEPAVLRVG